MNIFEPTLAGSTLDHNLRLVNKIKNELNRFAAHLEKDDWNYRKIECYGCFIEPLAIEFTQNREFSENADKRGEYRILFQFHFYKFAVESLSNKMSTYNCNYFDTIDEAIAYFKNGFC
jgi:hypothetical protein